MDNNITKPTFKPGKNIAMKVPAFDFHKTVAFYKDILGYQIVEEDGSSLAFDYDGKNLWIDKVETMSQTEIWLEIIADDIEAASKYFDTKNINRCDSIEKLPNNFNGFWIAAPGNVVHLVSKEQTQILLNKRD